MSAGAHTGANVFTPITVTRPPEMARWTGLSVGRWGARTGDVVVTGALETMSVPRGVEVSSNVSVDRPILLTPLQ